MSWEENVRKVVPYTPGEQPNKAHMIKLNTNECPYPPAPGVTEALAGLKPEDFRLYPDPNAGQRTGRVLRTGKGKRICRRWFR